MIYFFIGSLIAATSDSKLQEKSGFQGYRNDLHHVQWYKVHIISDLKHNYLQSSWILNVYIHDIQVQ